VKLAYRPACIGEWFCEEQFCTDEACWGDRLLVGFAYDEEAEQPTPVLFSDIAEQPAAYRSELLAQLARKYGGSPTGEYSIGGLYRTWHEPGLMECRPWKDLEIVGYKCTEVDSDIAPMPVFLSDLDWMAMSSEWFPPCR